VRHLLGDDGEAIRQNLTTNAARFLYHLISINLSKPEKGRLILKNW